MEEPWQLRWWADHFGVSVSTLLATILRVGNDARLVRIVLEDNPGEAGVLPRSRPQQGWPQRLPGGR